MGCPLCVQVGALYGSRAWQWPLQQAPLVVVSLLPVRALGASVEGAMGKGKWGQETSWEEVKRSFKDVCVLGWGSGRGSER